jgi:RNA polymerase sigma-70 factor (ECF subfamily)
VTLFPTTRWGEIIEQRCDPARRRHLLALLAADYRGPMVVYARCCGLDAASAEDAVQGFFTLWFERDIVERLDPAKGRLRSYLRTALRRYLIDQHDEASALKRGGPNATVVELSEIEQSVPDGTTATAEQIYDRAFAREVLRRAFDQLEAEFADGRRVGPFAAVREYFAPYYAGTHAELAPRYAMTEPQMASFIHRARGRFRELVRHQVRDLVADPSQLEAELRNLLAAL